LRILIIPFLFLFTTSLFTTPAFADTPIANTPISLPSITAFAQVSPGIYRGARPESAQEIASLTSLGIKTVINLQGGDVLETSTWYARLVSSFEIGETAAEIATEQETVEQNGMQFVSLPLTSLRTVKGAFKTRIQEALTILNDPSRQPVFIHCAHGADRTGLIIALYRMIHENVPSEKAYAEWIQMGHDTWHQFWTHKLDRYFWKYSRWLNKLRIQPKSDCSEKLTAPKLE
jgi:protein tyrosine phosphatase (PTP) superfamily phosphohydrolase (DUF442 family)